MTRKTLLELFEDAFRVAATDPDALPAERAEAAAKEDFFRPLAVRIRAGDHAQLLHAEKAACMVLGFLLLGVDEDDMEDRLHGVADAIVLERSLLIDAKDFAEGESDDEPE